MRLLAPGAVGPSARDYSPRVLRPLDHPYNSGYGRTERSRMGSSTCNESRRIRDQVPDQRTGGRLRQTSTAMWSATVISVETNRGSESQSNRAVSGFPSNIGGHSVIGS